MSLNRENKSNGVVGILAGMGPAAGADFLRLFVQACENWLRAHGQPVRDQAFPEHWVAQLPVPDRTRALLDEGAPQPFEAVARGLDQLAALGAGTVAIACNTTHAWHAALQARAPRVELLHIARETAAAIRERGIRRVALLAAQGVYHAHLYEQEFADAGIACALPGDEARAWLMQGIYDGVKAGDLALAQERFTRAARQLRAEHGDIALVMACTEIPLALPQAPAAREWQLICPSTILAAALAREAYGGI
jgi:aspartate racemase